MCDTKLKILFYLTDFVGPQNACIGIGQAFLERGHEVCFLVDQQHKGKFAKYGFTEIMLNNENIVQTPLKELTKSIVTAGLFQNLSPLEKMKRIANTSFIDDQFNRAKAYEPQIKVLLKEIKPDVIMIDSELIPPSLIHSNIPWIYNFCSNPIGLFDSDKLPPFGSSSLIQIQN